MKKPTAFFVTLLFTAFSFAQGEVEASGFDGAMRSNMKYYVVAVVLGIILSGFFAFMFRLDKRISQLEKK